MSARKARELCKEKGHELLYLTKFGSHLYGMNTPDSDTDYKGIFLPSKKSLILQEKCKSLRYTSGNDNDKNSQEDIDIDLWSLHYFLELVRKGETNALDLLFSPSHKDCVEYDDSRLGLIFNNPLWLFNPVKADAFIGYAIGQAKKYGISSSRLGVLKNVYEYINSQSLDNKKLKHFVEHILDNYYHDSYCFMKMVNGEEALVLCGKVHLLSISAEEFYHRVKREYERYGERVREAQRNENIDWKSISHALRAIEQMKELLKTGKIIFPLVSAQFLLNVKQGKYSWNKCEQMISQGIEEVENIKNSGNVVEGISDKSFVDNFILRMYNEL